MKLKLFGVFVAVFLLFFLVRSNPTLAAGTCGMNIDPANPGGSPSAEALKGVGWVRIEYKDCSTESLPLVSTSLYKPILQVYKAAGIKTLVILDYASFPSASTDVNGFAERTAYINSSLGGLIDAYEIWNEPDIDQGGNLSAQQFANIVNAVAPTLQGKTVLLGGLASGNPGYASSTLAFITASFTGFSVHPYGKTASGMASLVNAYRSASGGKPVWITEIGSNNPNNAVTANYLTSIYAGGVPADVIIWFAWSDAMVPAFGIVDASQSPKPQYKAFFNFENVTLRFTESSLQAVALEALKRKTGARGLRSILEEVMLEIMYELPRKSNVRECVITEQVIAKKDEPLYLYDVPRTMTA